MRSALRSRTTGTTPSGLGMVSTTLKPLRRRAGLRRGQAHNLPCGPYMTASVVLSVSQRLSAAVIRWVPGSVRTVTCLADSTVTFGRPKASAHTIT